MSRKHEYLWGTCVALLGVASLTQCTFFTLFCNDDTSLADNKTVSLLLAPSLVSSECYVLDRKTVFFGYGFNMSNYGTATVALLRALIFSNLYNVILVDWHLEAAAITVTQALNPLTGTLSYAFKGVEAAATSGLQQVCVLQTGTAVGAALVAMSDAGLPLEDTCLFGFSLGAQMLGQAARTVKSAKLQVGWVMGLDPAGPLYGFPLQSVGSGDAAHVMCAHCDPGSIASGAYAINQSLCDVDMYFNYLAFTQPDPAYQVQPGCPVGTYNKFTKEDMCSHNRCWMYMVESLLGGADACLQGSRAPGVAAFEAGDEDCTDVVCLGVYWDPTKAGHYYLVTNSAPPYDAGEAGYCP